MIERQNILKLLGSDKRRFHSCYITCYSFDFLFFELRVLPILRAAGIRNVNVLVDSAMFQQSIKNNISRSLAGKKSYSIIPIDSKGAFHPKMMMVFGKNEGTAFIGSGNLTSSGLSSNEEVWGSFYIDKKSEQNYSIFRKAYEMLINYLKDSNQSHKDKFNWIHKNTSWLRSVQISKVQKEQINNSTIQLLSNNGLVSIYNQLLNIVSDTVESVVMIAPFYNKNASLINNIISDLVPNSVTCIIDSQYGTWPTSNNHQKKVSYLDWSYENQDCHKRGRLHAKMLQINTNSVSYFLFGSANMTIEAMGTSDSPGKNDECCLLITTLSSVDYLAELGISLDQFGSVQIDNLSPNIERSEFIEHIKPRYRILHAEISINIIRITVDQPIAEPISITLLDIEGNTIDSLMTNSLTTLSKHATKVKSAGEVFKLILSLENEIVSNYAFIHHSDLIMKTNPDTNSSMVRDYLDKGDLSDKDLCSLLQQISFTDRTNTYNRSASNTSSQSIDIPLEEVDQISKEEFNRNEDVIAMNQKQSFATSSMLEMILENYYNEVGVKFDDVTESDETTAMLAGDEGLEETENHTSNSSLYSFNDSNGLKTMIEKAIKKITIHLSSLTTTSKINLDDIIHANIACQLIIGHSSKGFDERRSLITISRNNQPGDLKQLKSIERKFKLLKAVQKNPYLTNISYTINTKHLDDFEREIEHVSNLRLLYNDESPSQIINHRFIDLSTWVSNDQYHKSKGYEAFLNTGIGHLISNALYNKLSLESSLFPNEDGQAKFDFYSTKLYYRLLLIMCLQPWSKSGLSEFRLLILNLHYILNPEFKDEENVFTRLHQMITDQNLDGLINFESKQLVEESLSEYYEWRLQSENKSINKTLVSKALIGKLIFSKKVGFAKIDSVYENLTVDLISPLGGQYKNKYGYEQIFIGRSVFTYFTF